MPDTCPREAGDRPAANTPPTPQPPDGAALLTLDLGRQASSHTVYFHVWWLPWETRTEGHECWESKQRSAGAWHTALPSGPSLGTHWRAGCPSLPDTGREKGRVHDNLHRWFLERALLRGSSPGAT